MSNGNAAGAAVADIDSNVKIEDAGPCRKRLQIEIPASAVAEAVSSRLESVVAEAALPGFRPGRAPRRLIERRFGGMVRDEAKQQLAMQAYQSAVRDNKLRVLGDPEGGDELRDADMSGDKPVSFSLEVEVAPEITLPSLDGVEVKKPLLEVTDEMVDREVERLCVNEGSLEPQDKAGPGDYCIGHGKMTRDKDGELIHDINGAVIQMPPKDKDGKGMILGVMVDDLAKQAGSPKAGDTITI
ncbi:MAG: trigger factor family protein, partial [Planctomycetota bacterium]|nr:trigger factor family protein [Planctomycetota bacterium]